MSVESTIQRAEEDLARGDVGMARRRLSSLQTAFPADLDVRRALRDACRAGGDPAEAGRWGFVLDDATAGEVAAFRRSRGDNPVDLTRDVRWPRDVPAPAAARVAELDRRVRALPHHERQAGEQWADPDSSTLAELAGLTIAVAVVLSLAGLLALGLYQLVELIHALVT